MSRRDGFLSARKRRNPIALSPHRTDRLTVRLRAAASLLLMLVILTACATPAAPVPTPQPVKILFTGPQDYNATYTSLIQEFQKLHPGVTVEWTQVGGPGASSQLTCAACDVVRVGSEDLTEEQLAKYLPLDDLLSAAKGLKSEEMVAGAMEALRTSGRQVGVPAGINPIVVYYNRDLFQACKVSVPAAEWTLDDLAKAAQALSLCSGSGSEGAVYGFCSVPQSPDPAILAYLFGGQLVDNPNNPTRPTLNAQANVEAVQWYADLRRNYQATPDPAEIDRLFGGDINRAIFGGRCGMWLGFYLDQSRYASYLSGTGRPVPAMLPLPRGRAPFGVIGLDGYAILKTSQHIDVAWQWIQFLLDHPESAGPMLSPQPAQYRSKTLPAQVGQDAAAVARNLPSTLFVWGTSLNDPVLGGVVQAYLDAVERVVLGQTDAETALNDAQAKAEAIFKPPQ